MSVDMCIDSTKKQNTYRNEKPVMAVFDFDKTITDRHTFWRFLVYLIGPIKFYAIALTLIPTGFKLWRKKISLMAAREVMIRRCMKGVQLSEYERKGKLFSAKYLDQWLNPDAIKKLQWHQKNNHRCLLISNSAECYLAPWSEKMGFETYSGSRFEAVNGLLTGRLVGEHCQGEEKVIRLKQIVKSPSDYTIYAYGDSSGDENLLAIADLPFYRSF